jgi:hypothetical protein
VSDWFDSSGVQGVLNVSEVMTEQVWDALIVLAEAGALVAFSTTSDGGALGVTVTCDGRWRREYFREPAELLDWLGGAVVAVRAAKASEPASAVPASRRRRPRSPSASL